MIRMALHWQILIGMTIGAVAGISLNLYGGIRRVDLTEKLPAPWVRVEITDTSSRTEITATDTAGETLRLVVDPSSNDPKTFRTFEQLKAANGGLYSVYKAQGQSAAHAWGAWFQRIGNLFLRLLKMVAVPLIITSLSAGILGLGRSGGVGPMFMKTLTYYLATSLLAIGTGLLAVNVVKPGLRGGEEIAVAPPTVSTAKGLGEILFDQLEALLPSNPAAAIVAPEFLSIISFTLAFSIFTLRCGGSVAERIRKASETGLEVMMAMTTAIIRLAPLGVLFLMLYVTATQGVSVFKSLAFYMVAVASALCIHAFITLPILIKCFAKRSPWRFARAMSPALLTAFSSASSNGTLPLTITCAEKRAGISNRTSSFVLPLGATINMDGTALYEAVAVLFIAQLYHGANLPFSAQLVVAFTALLASIGAAGIPHAGLVMMVIILQAVGLPVEMQGIILAVDRVLDMARTTVNVWSDSCGCAVVEAWESKNMEIASPPPS